MQHVRNLAEQIAKEHTAVELVSFDLIFAVFDALVLAVVVQLARTGGEATGVAVGLGALELFAFLPALVATHWALNLRLSGAVARPDAR